MKDKFNIVLKRLKEAKLDENVLCAEFWRKIIALSKNFNEEDCWSMMIDNIEWLFNTGIMASDDLVSWFSQTQLNEHNIYSSGKHKVLDGFAIGIKKAKIEALGHSRVVLFNEATAEGYDTTFITGFENSSFEIKNCVGEAFDNCRVIAHDFSKVEAWDNALVRAETYSYVIRHDKVMIEKSNSCHVINL